MRHFDDVAVWIIEVEYLLKHSFCLMYRLESCRKVVVESFYKVGTQPAR